MKSFILTFVLTVVVVAVGATVFIYSGVYDVSASAPHGTLSKWAMSTIRRNSVARSAADIQVPNLNFESLQRAGIGDYEGMCVGCHGAPGKEPEAMGQGLRPLPPDLKQIAQQRSAAELFWVTKHGLKMTGMPAWGITHDDDALWPVVAFLTVLPELDSDAYAEMLAQAGGMGHHTVGLDNHEHASTDNEETVDNVDEKTEHEHSGHEH